MVLVRKTPVRVEVKQWWVAVKAHQNLFLRLVALDSVIATRFQDLDIVIEQLEQDTQYLINMDYPECVTSLREHMLHAMEHLIESLWNLKDRQLFEADLRFSIALVDMTIVEHELLEYGVIL